MEALKIDSAARATIIRFIPGNSVWRNIRLDTRKETLWGDATVNNPLMLSIAGTIGITTWAHSFRFEILDFLGRPAPAPATVSTL